MKIIYFDICSIPLLLMIIIVCYSRKMNKGAVNQLFLSLVTLTLVSAAADLCMAILSGHLPFSRAEYIFETVLGYVYLAAHNAANAVLQLFLLSLTRMTSLFNKPRNRLIYNLPNLVIFFLLAQNPFTHTVFTVSAETGYARGVLMPLVYAMAAVYGIGGLAYCVYSRRLFTKSKWAALLTMYLLTYSAVIIQFFRPELLLEMFFSAVGAVGVMLSVMRPEERMDTLVGMESWNAYQEDLGNILCSGERVQIAVIRLQNSQEIVGYFGEHRYNEYISEIAKSIRELRWKRRNGVELYFERPGTIYLIGGEDETGMESIADRLQREAGNRLRRYEEMGVRFEPQVCLIHCPGDLQDAEDIIGLGHRFFRIGAGKGNVFRAGEIVHSRSFFLESHMKEILNRAVREHHIEIYYQPIYDVRAGAFRSAEALARIIDPEFGLISPAVFIPAAESTGLIIPVGDEVLDLTFRFISEHDLDRLGLRYIEINLSVAQCMQSSLPEKVRDLQEKYGVDPSRVNLEITETIFESVSEIMLENVNELIQMGYSFSLDDYGVGYSSIQRVNNLPLKIIKLDKSMLDEGATDNGRMILEYTVRMMQSIDKKLVAEGAETPEDVAMLKRLACDYIQGFYYSRPLPENEFVRFMEEHNGQ